MPQNIYDDEKFYDGYSQLPRSVEGLAAAPEWNAVRALLPDLEGARILDLGCGFGAFGRWAIEKGAASVLGIDISENMLGRAQELTKTDAIEYRKGDLAALNIPESEFDLIYSALAFHYIKDFRSLGRLMRSKLAKAGRLVATVEHPIFTAPASDQWQKSDHDEVVWPLDGYFDEGRRERSWFADGVIKYHRTVGSYFSTLLENSFAIVGIDEWKPTPAQIAMQPEWRLELERPMFLIFSADAV